MPVNKYNVRTWNPVEPINHNSVPKNVGARDERVCSLGHYCSDDDPDHHTHTGHLMSHERRKDLDIHYPNIYI